MLKKFFCIFILIFFVIIFAYFAYKLFDLGNNISKSDDFDILNISSYAATVEATVCSNKNINKYILKQEYAEPNIFKQEVIEPENIKGLRILYDGESLILENKLLSLKNVYDNYEFIGGTSLSLNSFIDEYNECENVTITETDDECIMQIEINESHNKYEAYKRLYISKDENVPTKMEILDVNQNITVYILYMDIEINKISKEEILAS